MHSKGVFCKINFLPGGRREDVDSENHLFRDEAIAEGVPSVEGPFEAYPGMLTWPGRPICPILTSLRVAISIYVRP